MKQPISSRRVTKISILASYILLSAVPFSPWICGKTVDNPLWLAGLEIATWCAVYSVFKRPAVFHWFLLPAFILLPADVYLYLFYERGVSARHLAIVVETSSWEIAEFLGHKVWLMLLSAMFFLAWWWVIWRAALRTRDMDWTGNTRRLALGMLAVLALMWICRDRLPSGMQTLLGDINFSDTRPFGFFATVAEYEAERRRLSDLLNANRSFHFGAHQAYPNKKPFVIVMIIGESSRYDRWSLNGYARDTNPLLGRETNLVSAPDVITPASATLFSLPVMLSRKPAMAAFKTGFPEKSFITAFKEAGFKTWWLSNQIPFGEFDTPVSVFAREADDVQFMNLGSFSEASSLDEILFGPLNNALEDNAPKKLIILHTLGNHWNYSRRYSLGFDRWKPSLSDIEDPDHTDLRLKARINNSYDNSILYTDWFLSHVIETLKSSGEVGAMMYISDHGENLHDGNCSFVLHGHNSTADFHVPMIIWYSDLYASTWPEKIAQLRHHINGRLSTENIFHSLLDMADIRYPTETPEWSFLNSRFKTHKRYVDSYGWADYDHSTTGGDCHEVIDKGTPLPRTAGRM